MSVGRLFVSVIIVVLVITVCTLCGFSFFESVLILFIGILSLGFLGWVVVEKFKCSVFRALLFWWIAKLLDKPDLLYPK